MPTRILKYHLFGQRYCNTSDSKTQMNIQMNVSLLFFGNLRYRKFPKKSNYYKILLGIDELTWTPSRFL